MKQLMKGKLGTEIGRTADNDDGKEHVETGRNGSEGKYGSFVQKWNEPNTVVNVEGEDEKHRQGIKKILLN